MEVTSGSEIATATCSANVLPPPGCITNCGGGFETPKVVLLKKPPEGEILSYVFLSQIPYTGVGDQSKLIIFISIIVIWSAILAFAIKGKSFRKIFAGRFFRTMPQTAFAGNDFSNIIGIKSGNNSSDSLEVINSELMKNTMHHTYQTSALGNNEGSFGSVNETQIVNGNGNNMIKSVGMIDLLAGEAQKHRAIISEEGIKLIIQEVNGDASEAVILLGRIVESAESMFEREDGWLLLNRDKVAKSIHKIKEDDFIAPIIKESESNKASGVRTEDKALFGFQAIDEAAKQSFVNWLATGDHRNVFNFLSTMRVRGNDPEHFLKGVIISLDSVHRGRHENLEDAEEAELTNAVSGLSNDDLEKLIETLLFVVDRRYKSLSTSLKIALLRISHLKRV